jgi:hypothetical protein
MAKQKSLDSAAITIDGLKTVRAAFKKAEFGEATDAIKQANQDAAQLIIDKSSPLMRRTRMGAKIAKTFRAARIANESKVTLGSNAAPFGFGMEFGAKRFHQFMPWTGNGDNAGYFIFPTIRRSEDEIVALYAKRINDIFDQVFE